MSKSKEDKIFLCKNCGEDNPENFYDGRYSTCKKCRKLDKKRCVDKKKLEEMEEPGNFHEKFNNFLLNDVTLFKATTFQVINDLQDRVEKFENQVSNLDDKITDYQIEFSEFKKEILHVLSLYLEENRRLKSENEKMNSKFERIENELNELKKILPEK
jgi:chaperonin cofactor prefoldin